MTTKLRLWVVRIHFEIEAETAEAARQQIIDSQDGIEIEGLHASCVDNEEEIYSDLHFEDNHTQPIGD